MVDHDSSFIATIVISLALAYAGGLVARLIGLPNIVGYLVAGILVGPHTPGFVADQKLTAELAEIGVGLLMFTIGLHFSLRDLIVVWHIAVPGALIQIGACTALGAGLGTLLGWPPASSLVLGLAIAISSTVVSTKALESRQQLATDAGRIALGWLVVQDIVVIVALVLLPVISREASDFASLALILGKTLLMFAVFAALLLGLGRRLLPRILGWTAKLGSQELFTLGVIVIALGIAYGSAAALGLSFALGAFFAGLVLGESELSYQTAAESLPIQNIFTVLFFVSVGMLFDPMLFLDEPLTIAVIVLAIVIGCGLTFLSLMLILGVPPKTAGVTAGTLSQIGEFSFILTGLAATLALMSGDQRGALLAAALVTIVLHSLTMHFYIALAGWIEKRIGKPRRVKRRRDALLRTHDKGLRDHVIIVGYGRVGRVIANAVKSARQPHVVIEGQWRVAEAARAAGANVVFGDATRSEVFQAAAPEKARLIVIAMPDAFQTRRVIELARDAKPDVAIVARAHSDEEYDYLNELGVGLVVMGEREIALSISDYALRWMGLDAAASQDIVDNLRNGPNLVKQG